MWNGDARISSLCKELFWQRNYECQKLRFFSLGNRIFLNTLKIIINYFITKIGPSKINDSSALHRCLVPHTLIFWHVSRENINVLCSTFYSSIQCIRKLQSKETLLNNCVVLSSTTPNATKNTATIFLWLPRMVIIFST